LSYADGLPTGELTTLYEGGQKSTQGDWSEGLAIETHKVWSDLGEVVAEVRYDEGTNLREASMRFWQSPAKTPAESPR
jgi:antitoxin component YwqK of YwqJK toxin-antitoxin module